MKTHQERRKLDLITYPISIPRVMYRGAKQELRARAARENMAIEKLEAHVNELLLNQQEPIKQYLFYELASDLGMDIETVRKHGFSIDCGSNGFTAIKHGMSFQEAMDAQCGDPSNG